MVNCCKHSIFVEQIIEETERIMVGSKVYTDRINKAQMGQISYFGFSCMCLHFMSLKTQTNSKLITRSDLIMVLGLAEILGYFIYFEFIWILMHVPTFYVPQYIIQLKLSIYKMN